MYETVIKEGNLQKIKYLYYSIGKVSCVDSCEGLVSACKYGQLNIVKFFLEKISRLPESAYITALENGHINIVKFFTKQKGLKKLHLDLKLLQVYIQSCKPNMITEKFLLEKVCKKIKTLDKLEELALICIKNNNLFFLKYAMNYPNAEYNYGHNQCEFLVPNEFILSQAVEKDYEFDNLEIIKYLLSFGEVSTFFTLNRVMINACRGGNIDVVKFLVEHGSMPNGDEYELKENVMSNACSSGNVEMVKYVASFGLIPTYYNLSMSDYDVSKYILENYIPDVSLLSDWHKKRYYVEKIRQKNKLRKIFPIFSRNLLPVYYSPNFTGGILAKKDLEMFCNKLNSVN